MVRKKRQKRKQKKSNRLVRPWIVVPMIILIIISLIMISLIFYSIFLELQEGRLGPEKERTKQVEFYIPELRKPLANSTQALIYLPAVDSKGNGVMTLLVVEAIPGSGRTFVDIDNLLFWADTQHSIRIAKNVAENLSGINTSYYNFVYNIYADASVIGGESAGAAITIATISVLKNKSLREDVIITGTVNHDGTIGRVHSILAKAKAAKAMNASLFLVPLLQSREVTYESHRHCEKFGPTEVCTTEEIPKYVNVGEEANITLIEIGTIQDALKYFFET